MHKKVIILVAVFLLLMSSADAQGLEGVLKVLGVIGELCEGDNPLFTLLKVTKLHALFLSVDELATQLADMLARLILFIGLFFMIEDDGMFYNNIRAGVMSNPSLSPGVVNVMGIFVSMLQPIYILAIVLTAIYLLFMRSSIEGRAKAKSLLFRLIISLVVVSLSLPILTASIAISESLTDTILSLVDIEIVREILHDGIYGSWCLIKKLGVLQSELLITFYMILFSIGIWGPYMVIGLRHIMLVFFFMLFPISITLYSFSLSRELGRRMLELTIVLLLIQVFMAVTVLAISIGTYINPQEIPGLEVPGRSCGQIGIPEIDLLFSTLGPGRTDILSFVIGTVGHIFFITAPLMALRWFKGFLP